MLADDGAAVDGYHFAAWKGAGNGADGRLVVDFLSVNRHQHFLVGDKEVGIGGWQTAAIVVENGIGHGQGEQPVGLAAGCKQAAQLLLEGTKILVLLILRFVAPYK